MSTLTVVDNAPLIHSEPLRSAGALNRVIVVDSATGAEHHLKAFLEEPVSTTDLLLKISVEILFSKSVTQLLKIVRKRKRRFSYDRETSILKVNSMSRPLHDAMSDLISQFLVNAAVTNFLRPDEYKFLSVTTEGVMLARILRRPSGGTMPRAWTKYPDCTILFGQPSKTHIPRIVFEIGFAETYADLQHDARQWLKRSNNGIKLVVIVDIKDERQLNSRKATARFQSHFRGLVLQYGTHLAKHKMGIMSDQTESDEMLENYETYDKVKSEITTSDWVGPITARLEVWEIGHDGKPSLREPPIVSLHMSVLLPILILLTSSGSHSPTGYLPKPSDKYHRYHTRRIQQEFGGL
jgi:hypothetical protein